jgi:hypothetical protein
LIYSNDSEKILDAFDLRAKGFFVRGVTPRVLDKEGGFDTRQTARGDCAYHVRHARRVRGGRREFFGLRREERLAMRARGVEALHHTLV